MQTLDRLYAQDNCAITFIREVGCATCAGDLFTDFHAEFLKNFAGEVHDQSIRFHIISNPEVSKQSEAMDRSRKKIQMSERF